MKLRAEHFGGFAKIAVVTMMGLIPAVAHAQNTPSNLTSEVRIEQKLNELVPFDLAFQNESGQTVHLGDYFATKPVILVLAYYECPNLCTLVLNALLTSAQDLKFDAGLDFEIVVVSFDPSETSALAAAKKRSYTRRYGRPDSADGWHFLTGEEPQIRQLTQKVGFRYLFDPATKQFAHPSAIMVLTPEGNISRYFAGLEYPPNELRLALVEASNRRIGSITDQLFLFCFHYNPLTGKYGVAIMSLIRVAGCATVLAIGTFVLLQLRRDRRPGPISGRAHIPK